MIKRIPTCRDYELEDNLGNLENLNKIKVQTSIANGHFGIISTAFFGFFVFGLSIILIMLSCSAN